MGGKCNSRPGMFNHPLYTRGEGLHSCHFLWAQKSRDRKRRGVRSPGVRSKRALQSSSGQGGRGKHEERRGGRWRTGSQWGGEATRAPPQRFTGARWQKEPGRLSLLSCLRLGRWRKEPPAARVRQLRFPSLGFEVPAFPNCCSSPAPLAPRREARISSGARAPRFSERAEEELVRRCSCPRLVEQNKQKRLSKTRQLLRGFWGFFCEGRLNQQEGWLPLDRFHLCLNSLSISAQSTVVLLRASLDGLFSSCR